VSLRIIKSGIISTIQDAGRFGLAHYGVSQSGVADEHAAFWANHLLVNHFNAAVIEITLGHFECIALDEADIVITGADLNFTLNGKSIAMWQENHIVRGDKIQCSGAQKGQGVRAYIAVKGGFNSTSLFSSRSINVREHIGQPLQEGDIVDSIVSTSRLTTRSTPCFFRPNYSAPLVLRFMPSYQYEHFTQQQIDTLLNQTYLMHSASDRTGCRLEGQAIADVPSKMIYEGIAYGSIEITTAGQPIILLKDRPTIGGYPKIGTVFSLDLAKLAQRQPGTEVTFKPMALEEAQRLRRQFNTFFGIK
jgi:biotin-dependent carboxylase-like uncharacterized protein